MKNLKHALVVLMALPWMLAPPCESAETQGRMSSGSKISSGKEQSKKSVNEQAAVFASSLSEPLRPIYLALYIEGERNAVLNLDQLGLAALESGETRVAGLAFDAAIQRIEAIYAKNPNAEKARGLFNMEKVKDFKGEPYERAMTYFYRGLVYVDAHDFENGRASFLAAELQSTMGDREDYASTFGLMSFLGAWASNCAGDKDRAEELSQRAATVQADPFSSFDAAVHHLVLVDVGTGPEKFGSGKYGEKLAFKPSIPVPKQIQIFGLQGAIQKSAVGANLNFQAMTRGGRPIDAILAGKATWKDNTTAVSDAATNVGYMASLQGSASGNGNLEAAGSVVMLAGMVGGIFGNAMTPDADVRAWKGLPAAIAIAQEASVNGKPPSDSLSIVIHDRPAVTPSVIRRYGTGNCSILWARTEMSLPAAVAASAKPDVQERGRAESNAAWRSFLQQTFVADQGATGMKEQSDKGSP